MLCKIAILVTLVGLVSSDPRKESKNNRNRGIASSMERPKLNGNITKHYGKSPKKSKDWDSDDWDLFSWPDDKAWEIYKKKYNRSYSAKEDAYRRKLFLRALYLISDHNSRYGLGALGRPLTLDEYSDWSSREAFENGITQSHFYAIRNRGKTMKAVERR